ncbi:hypothetical protein B0H13DRAFT_1855471 [Mycena leptocephala]|nr:hypothetical protein B0H13DRAFT_1855471 [Mycena leptocephala]
MPRMSATMVAIRNQLLIFGGRTQWNDDSPAIATYSIAIYDRKARPLVNGRARYSPQRAWVFRLAQYGAAAGSASQRSCPAAFGRGDELRATPRRPEGYDVSSPVGRPNNIGALVTTIHGVISHHNRVLLRFHPPAASPIAPETPRGLQRRTTTLWAAEKRVSKSVGSRRGADHPLGSSAAQLVIAPEYAAILLRQLAGDARAGNTHTFAGGDAGLESFRSFYNCRNGWATIGWKKNTVWIQKKIAQGTFVKRHSRRNTVWAEPPVSVEEIGLI